MSCKVFETFAVIVPALVFPSVYPADTVGDTEVLLLPDAVTTPVDEFTDIVGETVIVVAGVDGVTFERLLIAVVHAERLADESEIMPRAISLLLMVFLRFAIRVISDARLIYATPPTTRYVNDSVVLGVYPSMGIGIVAPLSIGIYTVYTLALAYVTVTK